MAEPRVVTIEVPLVLNGCQQNAHIHWRKIAKAIAHARLEGDMAGRGKPRLVAPIRVDHEWFFGLNRTEAMFKKAGQPCPPTSRGYRPRDEQNAIGALKGTCDGIVDSHVIPGDTAKELSWGKCTINATEKKHKGRSEILLTFTELRGEGND